MILQIDLFFLEIKLTVELSTLICKTFNFRSRYFLLLLSFIDKPFIFEPIYFSPRDVYNRLRFCYCDLIDFFIKSRSKRNFER